ncbi:MAG TPA: sigma-70 family RNA polymerase sigma factor [Polyangia bacterium]|nr:sigma-70 family RNA polymerase sigma factor [Polyangia bacterium]
MQAQLVLYQRRDERPPLKVLSGGAARPTSAAAGAARGPLGRDIDFREVYERWFDDVVRWLYALGVPMSDTEDLAQEIFLVVRRNLPRFDGGNMAGWLYRIAQLTVRDHRRRAWFKNLVVRRQEVDLSQMPHAAANPAQRYEEAETRRQLQRLVQKMSEKLRTTFVLFEIEGYSGDEIARIQDIPLGTVWTRLHKARKEFWRLVKERHSREDIFR